MSQSWDHLAVFLWLAMTNSGDDVYERLIDNFRPRLCELITVPPVLDVLQTIGSDQKELIRQREVTSGNRAAAELLVDAVLRRPHEAGWFQAFVEALQASGCGYAADYIQVKLPDPQVEAENDYCVKLIHLLSPRLLGMKTEVVALNCFSQRLITEEDKEIVSGFAGTSKWLGSLTQTHRLVYHRHVSCLGGSLNSLNRNNENL